MAKVYKIPTAAMRVLVADEPGPGRVGGGASCFASDRIVVDGRPVGYMVREHPHFKHDSGWRFFAGDESEDYLDRKKNFDMHAINTVANHDPEIVPLLDAPPGSGFSRASEGAPLRPETNEA